MQFAARPGIQIQKRSRSRARPGGEGGGEGGGGAGRGIVATKEVLDQQCSLLRTGSRMDFHSGWSGWARPPTMGGGRDSLAFSMSVWFPINLPLMA